jgi:ureidoglycolate lyase
VNYARGVWHHPLIVLDAAADFIVVDRGGKEANCEETYLSEHLRLIEGDLVYSSAA